MVRKVTEKNNNKLQISVDSLKKNASKKLRTNLQSKHVRGTPSKIVSKVTEKNIKLKNSPDPINLKQNKIKKTLRSRTERAGINFPVGRVHRGLRHGYFGFGLESDVPVFIGAVLEYLCTEVLVLSGQVARETGSRRIRPRHIIFAVRSDEGLNELLNKVTIPDKTQILSQRLNHLTLLKGSQIPINIYF